MRQTRFATWQGGGVALAMFVNIVVSGDCEELLWQRQCLLGLELGVGVGVGV